MALSHLELSHFRNFTDAAVDFSDRLTLVVGRNGQGKTNLLEAVYLLMQGRDFRTAVEREAIQNQTDAATVNGSGDVMGRNEKWHHYIPLRGRRSHHGVRVPLVLFSPDDVFLAKGSPTGRRRFLDLLLSAHDPRYARSHKAYGRVLLQRNRALKDPHYYGLIDDFTPLLIREGLYLWRRRSETLAALLPHAHRIYEEIAPGEHLSFRLSYGGAHDTDVETENRYVDLLEQRRPDERVRQTTLVGPHRDDIVFQLADLPTTIYASQGQLRTVALSLKLATFQWLFEETGIRPIILLDDVLSELDDFRRQAVLRTVTVAEQQTIVTDTEPRSYSALDPSVLVVASGEVQPWNPPTHG